MLEAAKVIIIRHANSTFNLRWAQVEREIQLGNSTEEAFLDVVRDMNLLDCPLSELGIQQCRDAAKQAHSLQNIKTVFISPLRRALQTAHLLFKDHPNFSRIKFHVHPLLRENMHTVCDIPERFDVVKNEYSAKIPHLDFSYMRDQSNLWYMNQLQSPVNRRLMD